MKATSHAASGGDPTAWINVLSDGRSTAPQSASKSDDRVGAEHFEQGDDVGRLDEPRCSLECVEPRVARRVVDRSHVLDVDVLDLRDLVDEQIDETGLGKGDDQLVDRAARSPLEDLDAHDVAAHGTDAARDLAERTGAIGQPDPHRVVLHHRAPYGISVNGLFLGRRNGRRVRRPGARSTDCRAQRAGAGAKRSGDGDGHSFGSALRRLRTAWLMRCSFSMSANRTNASPPSPKPMPGDVATSASCTRNDANSSEPIS